MDAIVDPRVVTLAGAMDVSLKKTRRLEDLLTIVEALRTKGYVIVLKWDGERNPEAGDNGPFTAVITGGDLRLSGDFFRKDDDTLEQALENVLGGLSEWLAGSHP